MSKKTVYCAFLALFLIISVVLSAGVVLWGPSEAGANEILSKDPEWIDKEGNINPDYLSDLATWMSDHFFGRQELISAHNYLTSVFFGHSGTDSVVLGKDGWLFFTETVGSYTGSEGMSDRDLYGAARNLYLIQEYCNANGMEFRFMLAPNKNSLYPQFMPDFGAINESTDAQRLYQLLQEMGVAYIDLFDAFRDQEEVLYFAHDSHWNSKGAALGADLIIDAFGDESSYFLDTFSGSEAHLGDLFEMTYPAFSDSERNPVYGGQLNFTYAGKMTNPNSITLNTVGNGKENLLAFRDSFGILLYPYLADHYCNARFSRANAYNLVQTTALETDDVLIELVERNICYLIQNLHVMPAPVRDISLPEHISGSITISMEESKQPKDTVKLTGTFAVQPDTNSPVYVICGGVAYEAFAQEEGFGAYVPEEAHSIVYYVGGELLMFDIV